MRQFSPACPSAITALFRRFRRNSSRNKSVALLLPTLLLAGAALSATPDRSRRPANRAKPPTQDVNPPPAQQPAPQSPAPPNPASPNPASPNPASSSPATPSQTPTSPAPETAAPPAPARTPADVDPEKLQPFNLPPASRQRMRICGEQWRDLKMAGKSVGLTWRSFAEKCLPGPD